MRQIIILSFFVIAASACQLLAQSTQPATQPAITPNLALTTGTDEGKKVIIATVKLHDKALEGAKVAFFARRTFGELKIGEDTTLDDGTAQLRFPSDLPGGPTGQLQITARIMAPSQYASARASATFGGAAIIPVEDQPFPRAVWAPRAPLPLILTFIVLLSGVWGTYFFVLSQLFCIAKRAPM